MYAIIQDKHGHELDRYQLSENDILDCRLYADRYLESSGYATASDDGAVIEGDLSVTLCDDPENTAICWCSESFFIDYE